MRSDLTIRQRLSANVSTLFAHLPLESALSAAQRAGFHAIEIQYPYEISSHAMTNYIRAANLELVLINALPGSRENGERGLACMRGRETEFRASLEQAIEYAVETGCPRIHVLVGNLLDYSGRDDAFRLAANNLAWAVDQAAKTGREIVIEALNRVDTPHYLLRSVDEAADLIAATGALTKTAAAPRLLFDVYHAAKNQENLPRLISRYRHLIAHIQIADAPDRTPPGTGTVAWRAVLEALAAARYRGWIGCEYVGVDNHQRDFDWIDSDLLK